MSTEQEQNEEEIEQIADMSLRDMLKKGIAAQDGVKPEDVTLDYIQQRRQEKIYNSVRYDIDSQYGGYSTKGLAFLTRNEMRKIDEQLDEQIARLLAESS